ncbi:hypothetical protein F4780DRAFT_785990 [Xylariomycetidae sp. FL0641]|nr:hypothetical protein F4780DRAFT_785990 [Xylariomycetidae sp. FL0641]
MSRSTLFALYYPFQPPRYLIVATTHADRALTDKAEASMALARDGPSNQEDQSERDEPFTVYRRLPDELKLKIFMEAYKEFMPAVHTFNLQARGLGRPGSVPGINISPSGKAKDDGSVWRQFQRIAHSCKRAEEALVLKAPYKVCQTKALEDPTGPERDVVVDAANHLIRFKLLCRVVNFSTIPLRQMQDRFMGLKYIAINADSGLMGGLANNGSPFACLCPPNSHSMKLLLCPGAVTNFMMFFKDLDTFYLIFTIKAGDIKIPNFKNLPPYKYNRKRNPDGTTQAKAPCQGEIGYEYMNILTAMAKHNNLEIWRDARNHFVEITESSTEEMWILRSHRELWDTYKLIGQYWRANARQARTSKQKAFYLEKTKIKVLGYLNHYVRSAPVPVREQLTTYGPGGSYRQLPESN